MKFSHETRLQIDRLPSPSFLVFLTTVFFSTTHVGELATVRLQNVASIMLCIKLSFVDGGPYSVTMSLTPSTSNRNRKYLAPNKNKAKNEGEGGKWKWSVVFPLSFQTHVTSASHQTFFSYLMIPKKSGWCRWRRLRRRAKLSLRLVRLKSFVEKLIVSRSIKLNSGK